MIDEEISDSEDVDSKLHAVPETIRPKMASYRLEVIFWGVREMKKIDFLSVLRPKIVVECAGISLKSETMRNANKMCNFENIHGIIELVKFHLHTFQLLAYFCLIFD